ncbi:MAG: hypothetical protein HFP81_02495 [Methylococcales symbiont of Hymedesmia sp. n. MRB-2018]|nr:MAG: hypothetical protein HFP78_01090 [Methylococcales symbiont of Hymedesmia sp. n. MRB-2018]KAF3984399.1 MAG: hypothetical protein HFP81_02495 [Methylococcales symbiont of Hymedesmia sp. n. MRB-2018]
MYELLSLIFGICIFKKGPQDIPASNTLIRLLIPVYATISFLILILNTSWATTVMQVAVEILLIMGLSWAILLIADKPAHYQQTVCALMATDALISFIALPSMATLTTQNSDLAYIAILLLMVWHWAVSGHIFSHALDRPLLFGLAVSFMYILTSYQVMGTFFPEALLTE